MSNGSDEREEIAATQPLSEACPELAATADLSGRALGEFRLLRPLGQGGMGQVYLAEQGSLKRRVALKVLKAELAANPVSLQRFVREAETVAQLSHANIVQVYTVGTADGVPYMALEYVEGRNLRDFIARKGPPDVPAALSIMTQVAAALQRAAEMGVIHRDIKPENILLTRKGEVKVADFGLSRVLRSEQPALNLTQSGVTMGTPLYMSPEQVEGKPLDPRTDIYSFGVTCYHMLAGRPPFKGANAFEVALHHVRTEPEPLANLRPDLPPELCAVVHKMMAKRPEDRYASCAELLGDLARLREGLDTGETRGLLALAQSIEMAVPSAPSGAEKVSVSPTPSSSGLAPVASRRRWPWLAVAALLLALGVGALAGWLRLQGGVRASATTAPTADVGPVNPLFSEAEREKFLRTAVEQYWNRQGPDEIALAVGNSVQLLLFYLDRWRLDDAQEFARRLQAHGRSSKVLRFTLLGHLGEAIVLALKDEPEASNKLFLELVDRNREGKPPLERPATLATLVQYPRLHLWVMKALDHNYENAPEQFPSKQLDSLRNPRPLAPIGPRRGGDKPAGRGA